MYRYGYGYSVPLGTLLNSFPFESDLVFKASSRDGLSLPDEIGTDDGTILPAYLNLSADTKNMFTTDNQALDIGSSDFTLAAWIKSETATAPAVLYGFITKYRASSLNGRYGILCGADKKYAFVCTTSGGTYTITSEVLISDAAWHFHLAEIDQTAKKIRYFIDGVQIGADASFTGTFSNLSNDYKLRIGALSASGGVTSQYPVPSSYSDIRILHRLTTPSEKTSLLARNNITGNAVYYPCMGNANSDTTVSVANAMALYDASGNGLHSLNAGATTRSDVKYSVSGSRYGLSVGYTLYSDGYENIYIPYKEDGTELNVTPPAGFVKIRSYAGDSTTYNLSNALLRLPTTVFDRSNATAYADTARAGYYDAANVNDWHVTEINNLQKADWSNTNYKGLWFAKMADNSYGIRKSLTEIFAYDANKSGDDYTTVMSYVGDSVVLQENEFVQYKFTTDNIIAVNGSKFLKFDSGTVYLSVDEGVTYPYSKSVAGLTIIQFAHICNSGVIGFASGTKFYRSTNNLTTVSEITPTGIDGNPFVASDDDNFACLVREPSLIVGEDEIIAWGNYDSTASATNDNINVWFTKDDFTTLKSIYKAGTTVTPIAPLGARHIHAVNYNPNSGRFIIQTGDGTDTCNWIELIPDGTFDNFTAAKLAGDNVSAGTYTNSTYYKTAGLGFPTDYIFWGSDSDSITKSGIWKAAIADITTAANYVNAFPFPFVTRKVTNYMLDGVNMVASSVGLYNYLAISKDSGATFRPFRLYGLPVLIDSTSAFFNILPKSTSGWYSLGIKQADETLSSMYLNGTILMKIK